MKLSYRTAKNAEATAKYWGKSLDKPDWYKIEALSSDETEIILYDSIGWPFNDAGEFIRLLDAIKTSNVTLRINSPGGDVFDSVAIFNALQNHSAKVTTRIEALAASSASFIALAGKTVQAYSNAMMMIHDPWVLAIGNQYDLREIADILGKISGNMVEIYAGHSNIGKRETAQMMKEETWMTAKEAKEKGFVDTILESGKAAKAQFDLSVFNHVPESLIRDVSEDKELTKRDFEKALRDAGFSKKDAQTFLAGCKKALSAEEETKMAAIKTLTILGGKEKWN